MPSRARLDLDPDSLAVGVDGADIVVGQRLGISDRRQGRVSGLLHSGGSGGGEGRAARRGGRVRGPRPGRGHHAAPTTMVRPWRRRSRTCQNLLPRVQSRGRSAERHRGRAADRAARGVSASSARKMLPWEAAALLGRRRSPRGRSPRRSATSGLRRLRDRRHSPRRRPSRRRRRAASSYRTPRPADGRALGFTISCQARVDAVRACVIGVGVHVGALLLRGFAVELALEVSSRTTGTGVERAIPFQDDHEHASYDPDHARGF